MDLFQQETYQEDVLANNEWWDEIIDQLRTDLDHSLYSIDPGSPPEGDGAPVERPNLNLDELFGN